MIRTLSSHTGKKEHKREMRKLFSPPQISNTYIKRFYENALSQFNSSLGKKPSKEKNSEKPKEVYKKEISVYICLLQLIFFPRVQCPYYLILGPNSILFSVISSILPLIFHYKY